MVAVRRWCFLLALAVVLAGPAVSQSRETLWFGVDGGVDLPLFAAARYVGTGPEAAFTFGGRLPALPFLLAELEIGTLLLPVSEGSLLTGAGIVAQAGVELPPGRALSGRLYALGGYLQGVITNAAEYSDITAGSVLGGIGLSGAFRVSDTVSIVGGLEGWLTPGLGPFARASVGTRIHPVVRPLAPLAYELRNLSVLAFSGLDVSPLFPVLYRHYQERPIGRVAITNDSEREVSGLTVSFLVDDHMDSAVPCLTVDRLAPGERVETSLYALFSERVLENTENISVTARVLFDYTVDLWDIHQEASIPMDIYARNEITWDDDRAAAAFVTSRDPAILQFARNTAAWVEGAGTDAINWNLRMAMGMFEALRLYGMTYVVDPSLPYDKVSAQAGAVDFLQFPRETLLYSTGDCDDLSILYCALLQSLDIDTAFVTIPGHIYAAVSLGTTPEDARRTFSRPQDLILLEDEAWLPVEITALDSPFVEAWAIGAAQWNEAAAAGTAGFHPVREAWADYRPAGIAFQSAEFDMPAAESFASVYLRQLSEYAEREVRPFAATLQRQIADARDKVPLINRLGILYAQYGLVSEAYDQFDAALRLRAYAPAMINKANLLYLEGSYRDALALYQSAVSLRANPAALLGLARCYHALRDYRRAAEPYEQLKQVNPELAARYSYLDSGGTEATRASGVGATTGEMPWDYDE